MTADQLYHKGVQLFGRMGGAGVAPSSTRAQDTGKGNPAEDRPTVVVPNPVVADAEVGGKRVSVDSLGSMLR